MATRNVLITLIVLNALAVAGYGALLWRISEQSQTVSTFVEELAYEVDREARLRSLGNLLAEVAEDETLISERFLPPGEDAVVDYITTLESLARYAPVELTVLSVSTEGAPGEGTGALLVRIVATGSRAAVAELVDLIELLPITTTVDGASANVTRTESGSEQWDVSLSLRALMRS